MRLPRRQESYVKPRKFYIADIPARPLFRQLALSQTCRVAATCPVGADSRYATRHPKTRRGPRHARLHGPAIDLFRPDASDPGADHWLPRPPRKGRYSGQAKTVSELAEQPGTPSRPGPVTPHQRGSKPSIRRARPDPARPSAQARRAQRRGRHNDLNNSPHSYAAARAALIGAR